MVRDIRLAHDQAAVLDLREVRRLKALFPIEGDIAALCDQVLLVFDGGLDHFSDNRPQKLRQLPVAALRCQRSAAAADQAQFQVVDGEVRIPVPL